MNIFTFCGDMLHLASIFILLVKVYGTRSCKGVSLKSQLLYALVFTTRYLDLFYTFHSLYNSVMKIIFITSSWFIVYLMMHKRPICTTYEPKMDNFRIVFLIGPSALLALLINEYFSVPEILWTFSIYLEAVAIVPQLIVVHKYARQANGFVESLSANYVAALGGYRMLYLINWIYRYATEADYWNPIVWVSGVVQTAIYVDFFYYFLQARIEGRNVSLPM